MGYLVIANTSAMQALDEGAGSFAHPSLVRSPSSFASSAAELNSFETLPTGCTTPVEVLVGNRTRLNTTQWKAHYNTAKLPAGSLLDIGHDRLLTSAERFFLKTAPHLSVTRAILLGMELCGWYSTLMSKPYQEYCNQLIRAREISLDTKPWPPVDWGMSLEHQRDLMRNGFITRKPPTTPKRLADYLSRALSNNSNSRALVASRLLQANSHSPIESRLYARYCLPKRYGGLNLKPVELNVEIPLAPDLAAAIGIDKYTIDLLWPPAHIGIEYEGKPSHSGLTAEQKDRLKRNILEVAGIRIISIDGKQYANEDVLELYARQIAKGLGIPKWKLNAKPTERLARFELIDDLCSWDYDLYRPD
ncbi:MAG: hypothetical protein Q4C36_02950 [Coriobacteriia bacterium]|nr:hypothetical protein [Coriobacteriia bacterium]